MNTRPEHPREPLQARLADVLKRLESSELSGPERLEFTRELRGIQDELAAAQLPPTGGDRSLSQRLEARFGSDPGPRGSLDDEPRPEAGASSALFAKLRGAGPRGTRYRILGEVARGGMGAILKIWDDELRRNLAMKVVLGRGGEASSETPPVDSETLGRFLEEAQVTGQLDHPGIVPVHELGLGADGRVYFTMRLVKGDDLRSIFEKVRTGEDGWNQVRALGVILKVCEAMSYAHSKKVVHRDLKPANVMVGKFGEVYVMDWGLARVLGREDKHDLRLQPQPTSQSVVKTERREQRDDTPDSPLFTMDGDVVGTPSFMPPEQAKGQLDKLGPHSDVYSLGAMLYQLLTGEMPYVPRDARMSSHTVLLAVIAGPPDPIEKLAPKTPPELIAICEKAMARETGERYPTTIALGEDLRAFLEGRVVGAYETGALARARKWARRNKLTASVISVAIPTVAVLFGIVLDQRNGAMKQLMLAKESAAEVQAEADEKIVYAAGFSIGGLERQYPDAHSLDLAPEGELRAFATAMGKWINNLPVLEAKLDALQRRGKMQPHALDGRFTELDAHVRKHLASDEVIGESFATRALLVDHTNALLVEREDLRRRLLREREFSSEWDITGRVLHQILQHAVQRLNEFKQPDPDGVTLLGIACRLGNFPKTPKDGAYFARRWMEHNDFERAWQGYDLASYDPELVPRTIQFEFESDEPEDIDFSGRLIGKAPLTLSLDQAKELVAIDLLPSTLSERDVHLSRHSPDGAVEASVSSLRPPMTVHLSYRSSGEHTMRCRFWVRASGAPEQIELAIPFKVTRAGIWSKRDAEVEIGELVGSTVTIKTRLSK